MAYTGRDIIPDLPTPGNAGVYIAMPPADPKLTDTSKKTSTKKKTTKKPPTKKVSSKSSKSSSSSSSSSSAAKKSALQRINLCAVRRRRLPLPDG